MEMKGSCYSSCLLAQLSCTQFRQARINSLSHIQIASMYISIYMIYSCTLWQTNIAGWNIPMFSKKIHLQSGSIFQPAMLDDPGVLKLQLPVATNDMTVKQIRKAYVKRQVSHTMAFHMDSIYNMFFSLH